MTRSFRVPAACALAAALLALVPPHARAGEDLLDQYGATDHFRSGQPRAFAVLPDGREVLFLRSGPRDRVGDLWSLDVRTGRERVVLTAKQLLAGAEEKLSPEERARRERLRLSARGIASFELSPDGRFLLVPISGRLELVERASGAVRELVSGGEPVADAHVSPDGAHVACVRGAEVHVIDLADGAERSITPHEEGGATWGSPEFVAQEEMDRFAGWWWSPDSKTLLVQRTDETNVERMRIADPAHPEAAPQEWAYPRPGRANADVRLALIGVAGGAPRFVTWDRARYPYVCTVRWSTGAPLVVVMDREQHEEAVLAIDPVTGATRTLLVDRDEAFLNLHPGTPRWIEPDRAWLWMAERDDSGPWLERRGMDPAAPAVRLTPPGLRVHEVLAVDAKGGVAYVLASDDPRETHAWRVPLDPNRGAPKRLGADAGVEGATFAVRLDAAGTGARVAPDRGVHVRALRPKSGWPRWIVEDGEGRALGAVRSVAETPIVTPNLEWLTVGSDSLRAVIVRPRDFDPGRRYPVIDWAYAGPHSLQAGAAAPTFVIPQWIADHGFVLVAIDGRGTPWRGRSWERAIRGDLAGPALADHVAGLTAVCARYPQLDGSRVGVMGWSFGGYFTAMALEHAPQLYRAGVAGAPVVDWRDYDTFYTERYLGLPGPDSLAYARSSVLTRAATLSRPMLLIHGTADDNVYFFNSMKLVDALERANVPFEFLPLPGQTHSPGDPVLNRYQYARSLEFLRRTLGEPGDAAPPRP